MTHLAVGFFDGIHAGHRRILENAAAAITFREHPAKTYAPERAPALLMTPEARLAGLSELAEVDALDFTPEFAAMEPEDFAEWLRARHPEARKVYCGENWTFGAGGRGTPELLAKCGFEVEQVPYAVHEGERVSSTRIRGEIAKGRVQSAAAMLGRPWRMEGKAARGKGLGAKIGFPTINVLPDSRLVKPARGVYAVATEFGAGVANFGKAPTMGPDAWAEPVLEVHLLEAPRGLSIPEGAAVRAEFLRFIRAERKFADARELAARIAEDAAEARRPELPDFIRIRTENRKGDAS